ncbi:MAG: endonuclease domain-containing protein [Bacteroidales bacterium]
MKVNKTIEAEFFFGATPVIFERARELRKNMTNAEKHLWEKINKKQINGLHFRRQHPVSRFIADFYCHKAQLVIEVDGNIHLLGDVKERDEGRNYFMNELGLEVLRFTNEEILNNINEVVEKIKISVITSLSHVRRSA